MEVSCDLFTVRSQVLNLLNATVARPRQDNHCVCALIMLCCTNGCARVDCFYQFVCFQYKQIGVDLVDRQYINTSCDKSLRYLDFDMNRKMLESTMTWFAMNKKPIIHSMFSKLVNC